MTGFSLLLMAAINLVAAVLFLLTALQVSKRSVSPSMRLGGVAFTLSWIMLAAMTASDGARLIVAWAPSPDVPLYTTLAIFKIVATAIMIAGFGYYVAYIITGKKSIGLPILFFALSHGMLFLYILIYRTPMHVISGTWGAVMTYEHPPMMLGGTNLVTYIYYFAPPILLAVAFLAVLLRHHDRPLRRRAIATGLVVLAYHATGFVLFSPGVDLDHVVNPIALGLVALTAAFAWSVHRQPRTVQATNAVSAPGPPRAHP